jgi:hypothetical protein
MPIPDEEGIGAELERLVRRLRRPDDEGRVAVDVLAQQVEAHPRLRELPEQPDEERADGVAAPQQAIGVKSLALGA